MNPSCFVDVLLSVRRIVVDCSFIFLKSVQYRPTFVHVLYMFRPHVINVVQISSQGLAGSEVRRQLAINMPRYYNMLSHNTTCISQGTFCKIGIGVQHRHWAPADK